MFHLRLLGGLSLQDEGGREVDAVLRRPKQAALLAYLAMPQAGTWHRRDHVVAVFWPTTDQMRARSSLRSALRALRQGLPDGSISTRGDEEICLMQDVVTTDVMTMAEELANERFSNALECYRGDFLPGLFVADAPDFDRWADAQRLRLRTLAWKAATQVSLDAEGNGLIAAALEASSRACELNPDDEGTVRRHILLLDRSGDRGQAFIVYERFRNRMMKLVGVRPSAETVALMDAIRERHQAFTPQTLASADTPLLNETEVGIPAEESGAATLLPPAGKRHAWRWLVPLAAAVGLIVATLRPEQRATGSTLPTGNTQQLIVLPMESELDDDSLAFVASGVADGATRRLSSFSGLKVHAGAHSGWAARTPDDLRRISDAFDTRLLLRTTLGRSADSLRVSAFLLNLETNSERQLGSRSFTLNSLSEAENWLAIRVIGELFRIPSPTFPESSSDRVHPESYELTMRGWHQWFVADLGPDRATDQRNVARSLFERALQIDPLNARAWSGLATFHGNRATTGAPFSENAVMAIQAARKAIEADSSQGSAWANLAIMHALRERDLRAGLDFIETARRVEPSNPEVLLIWATMLLSAHRYSDALHAQQLQRALDPLNPNERMREADTRLCMAEPGKALQLAEEELRLNPESWAARRIQVRALANLGRYQEALDAWRTLASITKDENLVRALGGHLIDAEGYWRVRHDLGRARLQVLDRQQGWVSPFQRVRAAFAAGDLNAAEEEVELALAAETPALYRLNCMAEVDEFRGTPKFAAIISRIGSIDRQ